MAKNNKELKRYKSFEAWGNDERKNEFDAFATASKDERARILRLHRLNYGGIYDGYYDRASRTVEIKGKLNPFTGKTLKAKLIDPVTLNANTRLTVKLIAFKDNGKLTPDNVSACRLVGSRKEEKRKELNGIHIYSKSEIEREEVEKRRKNEEKLKRIKEQQRIERERQIQKERAHNRRNSAEIKSFIIRKDADSKIYRALAQREHPAHNRREAGSNPVCILKPRLVFIGDQP